MRAGEHFLVQGAARGIGMEIVKGTLRAGHRVHAFLRLVDQVKVSDGRLEKRWGGILTNADIDTAVEGIGVMIKALDRRAQDLFAPVKLFFEAARLFVTAIERGCLSQLISVTEFDAKNSRSTKKCMHLSPFLIFPGEAFGDKGAPEHWVKDRDSDCTIARPGVLVPIPRCGHHKALIVPLR